MKWKKIDYHPSNIIEYRRGLYVDTYEQMKAIFSLLTAKVDISAIIGFNNDGEAYIFYDLCKDNSCEELYALFKSVRCRWLLTSHLFPVVIDYPINKLEFSDFASLTYLHERDISFGKEYTYSGQEIIEREFPDGINYGFLFEKIYVKDCDCTCLDANIYSMNLSNITAFLKYQYECCENSLSTYIFCKDKEWLTQKGTNNGIKKK